MQYFNHHITLKSIVSFMDLFTRYVVERYNADGTVMRTIRIPIQYTNREKYLQIIKNKNLATDLNDQQSIETDVFLPRISVSMMGMAYEPIRHVNNKQKLTKTVSDTEKLSVYNPVPYRLQMEMTILAKTMDDMFQILEQILPIFSPSISMNVNLLEGFDSDSIPVVLSAVTPEADDDIDVADVRLITYTLSFDMFVNYYMPKNPSKIIRKVQTNLFHLNTMKRFAMYEAEAINPTPITDLINRIDEPVIESLTEFE